MSHKNMCIQKFIHKNMCSMYKYNYTIIHTFSYCSTMHEISTKNKATRNTSQQDSATSPPIALCSNYVNSCDSQEPC